ncbi:MAG: LamG domain-containing protein [Candidatus Pseudobacter hemicellulosilyticus]|uniref:LamG domain-containing protein n=1 Tax=Candidatus Pseudobacter hemicellulosilyticus TaxID=3121375 RepID=A0AAJ6BHI4_9BACT|nr:MAG: LamG domain-containing protein [Pseudobacter sp.]
MRLSTIITCGVLFLYSTAIVSCSKDDDPAPDYNSNKSRLKTVIDSLTTVYNASVEGSKAGQYIDGSKATLDSVLTLGNQVFTGNYTQQQVNNAVVSLMKAGETFSTKLLQEVSAANLMAFWKFTGNPADSSGHDHHGTLLTGLVGNSAATAADGGVLPKLMPDRFGRADMAYEFRDGATIEVPYSSELNPQNLTITGWVKRYNTNPGNYIISLNRWNGYKLNLQSNNFLFFTFQDSNNGFHDIDNNPGAVPENVWTHFAVTYTNGTMIFYLDGSMSKTLNVNGTPITVTPAVNLSIGNELPKSYYNLTSEASPFFFWGGSYFTGGLDDIRLYNTALTANEVLSIYTQERTP